MHLHMHERGCSHTCTHTISVNSHTEHMAESQRDGADNSGLNGLLAICTFGSVVYKSVAYTVSGYVFRDKET